MLKMPVSLKVEVLEDKYDFVQHHKDFERFKEVCICSSRWEKWEISHNSHLFGKLYKFILIFWWIEECNFGLNYLA